MIYLGCHKVCVQLDLLIGIKVGSLALQDMPDSQNF